MVLDIFRNLELYEQEYRDYDNDINLWISLIRKYKPQKVLELACGSGRISKHIYNHTNKYVGIDISSEFIEGFKKLHPEVFINNINYVVCCDMINFNLSEHFDMIILPFNAICHIYNSEDFSTFCKAILEHLAPNGLFIIDCMNPNFNYFLKSNKEYLINKIAANSSKTIYVYEQSKFDKISQVLLIERRYLDISNNEEFKYKLPMRMYFPGEIQFLLEICGFEIMQKFGSYEFVDFSNDSSNQIIICKAIKD